MLAGTMSGGGGKVCKGRMGASLAEDVDPEQLRQMETKLQQVERNVYMTADLKNSF